MSGVDDKIVLEQRQSSSDIIAQGQAMKQKMNKDSKDQGSDDLRAELQMDEHKLSVEELAARLDTSVTKGLTASAVEAKQLQFGENKLTPPPETPEWLKFLRTQTGFFSLLLWGGGILCFVGFGLKKEVDNLYLGIVLCSVVLITGIFSYSQERKSSDLMNSFKDMMPTNCLVKRNGKEFAKYNAIELVPGDVVRVKSGDKIPADLRIIECSDDMKVDNSCLTGESDPQQRKVECTDPNPLETKNLAFFGTLVPSGKATGIVVNTGDRTVMGRIAQLASATGNEQTPINKEIEHFVLIVSGVAIFLGVTFFVIGLLLGVDWITNLVFMIGIIVANVPEGLLATVTVCLTLTAKRMYSKMVLVKNLEAVETLGSTTCICSDKTGTLTQNIMTVANLVFDQAIWKAECSMSPVADYDIENPSLQALLRCATLCNNATFEGQKDENGEDVAFEADKVMGDGTTMKVVQWGTNGDASESALIKWAQKHNDIMKARERNFKLKEIPFNSTNKFQLSVHKQDRENKDSGKDRVLVMKGAPERIISRCDTMLANGEVVPFTAEDRERTEELQLQLSRMGRRVLGFCEKVLPVEQYGPDYEYDIDRRNFPMGSPPEVLNQADQDERQVEKLCFLGLLALIDPPRPQVPGAVAKCKTAGIKVIMVTGDHPETAKAISKEVGIIWGPTKEDLEEQNAVRGLSEGDAGWEDPELAPAIVVPGWTINNTDTTEEVWDDILDHSQVVFARTSPQQKLIIVENCQRRKEVVAVTGDGVNDAPALKKADIGVAMGIMGSDVSKEAADMILLDDNFASIVSGVEEGRLIFDNLKKSIAYTLSSNIPEISPFLAFITIQIPLALSTILILCVDLGTDMVPAISMAWENAESDIMRRNPRNAEVDRLVTKKLVCFAYLQIGMIQACAGFYAWTVVLNDYGYPPHILPGLGALDNWGKQVMFCKLTGGVMRDETGTAFDKATNDVWTWAAAKTAFNSGKYFWDPVETNVQTGVVENCVFALKNFKGTSTEPAGFDRSIASTYGDFTAGVSVVSENAIAALHQQGYVEYLPYRARLSNFYDSNWLNYEAKVETFGIVGSGPNIDVSVFFNAQNWGYWTLDKASKQSDILGLGVGETRDITNKCTPALDSLCTGDSQQYIKATFTIPSALNASTANILPRMYSWMDSAGKVRINVASRMLQKEALHHAQTAGFICIIVVQWADLLICKTRWLSLRQQGMRNPAMNFGLVFETLLGAALCYIPGVGTGLGTRPLRLTHWFPGMPFSIIIFCYDETRKALMRKTSVSTEDPETKRITRTPGWIERNTYY